MNNYQLRQHLHDRKERWEIKQASWLDALGLIVPLAAPLVPAFLTATAIITYYPSLLGLQLGYVIAIAVVAGGVIELLGILSIETMFDMRTYNQKYQTDEAPFAYAVTAVAFYLVLVIGLVLLLKIWHELALWSLAPLTVLGFVTSWVMVLRKQHSERVHHREMADANLVNATVAERDHTIADLTTKLTVLQRQLAELTATLTTANANHLTTETSLSVAQQTICELRSQIADLTQRPPAQRPVKPAPTPDTPRRLTPDQCQAAIVAALSEHDNQRTFAQLTDLVGVSLNTVKAHCRVLSDRGQVDIDQNVVTLKPVANLPTLTATTSNGYNHA